ncbi:polysaccharide biosynthesis/export family protein [Massilia sp. S19_KUP03_FR1]|uniref:polysaccharide biosynthesis/export family protein n=1 Tax=Massilia sp. S19_KUP03_FR1 TaxID=3025503 RepID=UPI002FCDC9CC
MSSHYYFTARVLCTVFALCNVLGCASDLHLQDASTDGNVGQSAAPVTEMITEQLVAQEKAIQVVPSGMNWRDLVQPDPPPYTIGSSDILSITVWDHPELAGAGMAAAAFDTGAAVANTPQQGFSVDHRGSIQFPYAGQVQVAGLTEEAARDLLVRRLAKYIASPNVTLRVQAFRSKRVYVDGEVKNAGVQAINDLPMTLVEALNRAGGLLPTADQSRIWLERGEARYSINLRELVQKGVNPGSLLLAHGDVVRVHSREESKVFVSGEVVAPKALTMHDGRLTLNEALGETGGISPLSGDARQIYVVRKTPQRTRVFQLDARQTGSLAMAESFELQPKDIVFVAATPLANWNRKLSLLFPGALTSAVGVSRP